MQMRTVTTLAAGRRRALLSEAPLGITLGCTSQLLGLTDQHQKGWTHFYIFSHLGMRPIYMLWGGGKKITLFFLVLY